MIVVSWLDSYPMLTIMIISLVLVADTRSRPDTPLLHFRKLVWRVGSRSSRGPSTFSSWPRTRGASSPHQVCHRQRHVRQEQHTNRKPDCQFAKLSDTTVTVSIATVPNYTPVKTEVPSHSFSVTLPNNCTETDSHVGVFDRQLAHNGVQFSPSTQSRTPPDSTFTESFKDGSQEVCVSIPLSLNPVNALTTTPPSSFSPLLRFPLVSSLRSHPIRQKDIHLIPGSQRWAQPSLVLFEHTKIATSVLLCHCLTNTIKCCTFLLQ